MAFGSTTLNPSIYNIPKTPVPKEKKDLCNYHRPNYLSILVLNMQPLLGKTSPCKDIDALFPEILMIKESCNLIG